MPLFREEKYNASALVSEISNADNTQTISAQSFMLIPHTNNISISQQTYNVEATVNGPRREKTCLRRVANNKGTDQPAHPRSLISAFVFRFLESITSKLATSEISTF